MRPARHAISLVRRYPAVTVVVLAGVAGGVLEFVSLPDAAHILLAIVGANVAVVEAWRMFRDLRSGRWGLDVLAISAVAATIVLGEFWAAFIVTLMIVGGEGLEDFASMRARRQISALLERAPQVAHRQLGPDTEDVPVGEVVVGDRLLVRAGEVVPVDGTLVDAEAEFDQSSLTGESLPVTLAAGAALASGIVAQGSAILMIATKPAADSQYQRIVAMVEAGASVRGRFVRIADRVAIPFTALAYLIAVVAWVISGDPVRFAEVLVVATPCPLLVAAPTALVAGMGRSARSGLVVKSGETLERLAAVRSAAFDKTGTLTLGRPVLQRCESITDAYSPDRLLAVSAAVEAHSAHVLSAAVVDAAVERGLARESVTKVREVSGRGMSADWRGAEVRIGRAEFAGAGHAFTAEDLAPGEMAIYIGVDGGVIGRLVLRDGVRPDAADVVSQLRRDGIRRIVMVTGDAVDNAVRVATELGLDEVHAGLLPGDKVTIVQGLRPRPTLMVGDGVNDAPVLAAADVGIAMGARGATAASQTAEAVLLVDELARIPVGLAIARRTLRIARQSIVIGIGLSIGLMIIAATGVIPAVAGALLQEMIDVVTILNGLRAGTKGPVPAARDGAPSGAWKPTPPIPSHRR